MRVSTVLILIRRFPPWSFGGGELSAYTLARHIAKSGVDVYVLTGRLPLKDDKSVSSTTHMHILNKIEVPEDTNNENAWNRNALSAFRSIAVRPDIIHVHDPRLLKAGLKYAHSTGLPSVATINDLSVTCYYSLHFRDGKLCKKCNAKGLSQCMRYWGGNKLAVPYILMRQRDKIRVLNSYDGLLCRSEDVMQILSYNGVKTTMMINPPAVEDTGMLSAPSGKGILLYIGRVDRGKGIGTTIRALLHLDANIKLRVVGDGPYLRTYKDLTAKLGLEKRVVFKGSVDHSNIMKEYEAADITINAATRVEPMPRTIFESSLAGRAIIVSDITGGREYIEPGVSGDVVPAGNDIALADAVNTLYESGIEKASRAAGRIIREKYKLKEITCSVIDLYNRATKHHRN